MLVKQPVIFRQDLLQAQGLLAFAPPSAHSASSKQIFMGIYLVKLKEQEKREVRPLYTFVPTFTLFYLENVFAVGHKKVFRVFALEFVYINSKAFGKIQGDLYFVVCWHLASTSPSPGDKALNTPPFWYQNIYYSPNELSQSLKGT